MSEVKGKFIVIYGINNIGKTTQAKLLVKKLKEIDKPAVYVKYPVYSMKPTGHLLNKILRSGKPQGVPEEDLQLLYVLNRYQFQPALQKWLRQGKIVVAEDYIGTGVAWGMAKGANQAELEDMNKFLVQEDIGILLEGRRKHRAKEKDHLHEQQLKLIKRCIRAFRNLQKKYKWEVVKVEGGIEETARRLWEVVGRKISNYKA